MSTPTRTPDPGAGNGRRQASARRVGPTAVLAVLLPLLTVGALALVQPAPDRTVSVPADVAPVDQAELACPPGLGDRSTLAVAAAGRPAEGSVGLGAEAGRTEQVRLRADAVTAITDQVPATVVRARGAISAELLAARFQPAGLAAAECVLPRPSYSFTGVGADADHASVLQLTNPDAGPAVAEVRVLGRTGALDAPQLRGVTVGGGQTVELELAEEVPTREELALEVVVSRGRLGASVSDAVPALGARRLTQDWLPAAGEAAEEQLLLGLVEGRGRDDLTVANPGEDEVRVEVRVVTEDASFVPEGLRELRVAPGSVEEVQVTDELRSQVEQGALGLELRATGPVTAALGSVVDDDRVHAPAVTRTDRPVTALLPPGRSSLVLAGAEGAGVVTVEAYDDGQRLGGERVELTEGSGGAVRLPARTSLVRVVPRRTAVAAAVRTTGDGATVTPLQALVRTALVPDVRPGLP